MCTSCSSSKSSTCTVSSQHWSLLPAYLTGLLSSSAANHHKLTSSFTTWLCSSWNVTKLSIMSISLDEVYFKNLWKPLRTASDAKVTLLTSAERRSVSSPGVSRPHDSYIWHVMRKSATHNSENSTSYQESDIWSIQHGRETRMMGKKYHLGEQSTG